jgi:hypothetical protein
VLINGSPTSEINIQRGLKQGDPLAPFLFLLVTEGLGGLLKRAVELNRFKGFRIGSQGVQISRLQYADDTLCIGEASIANLWTLKAILRGFELCSGLKVNFRKSSLMGVNVSQDFMRLASIFLNCRVGVLPFNYLGLPVGANPRRASTWEPMLNSLRKRLGVWGNKYVSLGGRIVLLNSVLNAIPIFYLSFLKISIAVWKKVRKLQREFLWGGKNGVKKINWVKWETICKPKHTGGLGVRDIRLVNISLLTKWRWRLLYVDQQMWKKVSIAKYGVTPCGKVDLGEDCKPWFSSLWWKDISSIGKNINHNWFSQQVVKKIGNGRQTSFWLDNWLGDFSLRDRFPRLFSVSTQKEASVATLWSSLNDERWTLTWRRRLFVWENNLLEEFMLLLNPVSMSLQEDQWVWRPDDGGNFSVKSTYELVSNMLNMEPAISPEEATVFKVIWKCPTPSKVSAFVWKVLLDRIPTKVNLFRRRVIQANGDQACTFCGNCLETSSHLLLYCDFAIKVWQGIFDWLGLSLYFPHNFTSLYNNAVAVPGGKQVKRALVMICGAVFWSLWHHRNQIVFENGVAEVAVVIDRVKISSWKWWVGRLRGNPCLLYEWQSEPIVCMAM